jgi:hypothetical protein
MPLLHIYFVLVSSLHCSSEHILHQVHPISISPSLDFETLSRWVNSSFWVMLSFVSWERFSDFDSDHVLILTYLLMGERPYIPMDLVDLVVDVLAELGVDRVNKEIVDSDYKPIEGLRYIRIQRVIHPKNIHVEEGCIVDHSHSHSHYRYRYWYHFAYVVIDV